VRTYLGRVTKARILEAVREGVSFAAADRIVEMKKPDMADAAEQLLAATDWLPAPMRTPKTVQGCVPTDASTEAQANAYADAAE
jgi:ParB family transcriptional regulator, chromosome partitioning protein